MFDDLPSGPPISRICSEEELFMRAESGENHGLKAGYSHTVITKAFCFPASLSDGPPSLKLLSVDHR